jgi:hypothetical protein
MSATVLFLLIAAFFNLATGLVGFRLARWIGRRNDEVGKQRAAEAAALGRFLARERGRSWR